ncbi:DUF3500 domain-containing protein [Gulosibacter faecalis]|uniref:DUF3500 domain-containing protein n=1 Tax=Gulosibacter faecalis TaxID=272240 RepID=A0ABW5V3N1_9MICO|nr:DUF3500 domain-containing protein [Gulosibacter faecalis]
MANDIDEFFSSDRTAASGEAIALPDADYREFVYDLDDPIVANYREMNPEEFTEDRQRAPFLRELLEYWNGLYAEPFVGITTDGRVREGVYQLPAPAESNRAEPIAAALALLEALSPEQRAQVRHDIEAPEWRGWSNPEFIFHRIGLRLEQLDAAQVTAVHDLLRASLSEVGYERVAEAMALNGYLGELTELPKIMNDRSYWFAIYGTPGADSPWGWQLFGHHVAVHFVAVGGREVIAPVFIGAEPAISDPEHPPVFEQRERLALELAASFTPEQRERAVVYDSVLDDAMPEGRIHPADERHVAGAFRDNRVVPTEGIRVRELDARQQQVVRDIVRDSLALLDDAELARTLAEYDAVVDDTWVSWYGATDGSTPSYLRVQGPSVLTELDHHAGVWLSNRTPARFHVHSTLRHPNGNDYGKELLRQWRAQQEQPADA